MVSEEISDSIAHSVTEFEAYLANSSDRRHLDEARNKIAQVGGTFRLLEFPGAALLADEMALLLGDIGDESKTHTAAMVDALTHAFFVLPRYIEYVAVKQLALPTLILPYVNEMRVSRKVAALPEYHFYGASIPVMGMMLAGNNPPKLDQLAKDAKRLNHMYQAGLVGAIRAPDNLLHYNYMSRALNRVVSMLGDHPRAEILQIAAVVLECFAAGRLELTLNRKRNLGAIEKCLRGLVSKSADSLADTSSDSLKRDLLFLLMLTRHTDAKVSELRQAYSLPFLTINDDVIVQQRRDMHGPSLDTLDSVIKVLNEELHSAKDVLELGSQNGSLELEDIQILKDTLVRVADTLSILNLSGPKKSLMDQVEVMSSWVDEGVAAQLKSTDFLQGADIVLYVESALSSLNRRDITVDELNAVTESTRKKIVATSHLAEAERLVIEEAQAGISLAKRAITSYVESNFDSAHIANVAVTLNTVRGGLQVLNYSRAANILKHCSEFVTSHIKQTGAGDQRHQLLETLADALISLEYYLNEVETSRNVNENILDVAEESLAALGFTFDK
jgi:hypothetical protein